MFRKIAVESKVLPGPGAEDAMEEEIDPGPLSLEDLLEQPDDLDERLIERRETIISAVAASTYGTPALREALTAAAHVCAIVLIEWKDRGFTADDVDKYERYGAAFTVLAGLNIDRFVKKSRDNVFVARVGVTWNHPLISFNAEAVLKEGMAAYNALFEHMLYGLGRITSLDVAGEESPAARRLFENMDYTEGNVNNNVDVMALRSRLQTYDLYFQLREHVIDMPTQQIHRVAIGLGEVENDPDGGDARPAAVNYGGRGLHALRGQAIPKNFEKYARNEAIPGGGFAKVLELYAAEQVAVTYPVKVAMGFPKTLAEISLEQRHIPPTASNRIARFCRRIDAIIGVGRDPTVLVQNEWNIPAEVLRTLVEERKRIRRPLTLSDLALIEDALEIV
jgi:hypothetical protein